MAPAQRSRCSRASPRLTSSRTVGRPRRRTGSRPEIKSGASSRSARAATARGGGPSASWSHSIKRAQPASRHSRSQSVASVSRSAGAAGRSSARIAYKPKLQAGAGRRGDQTACSTRPRRRARSPAGSARRPARPRARRPARPRRPATAAATRPPECVSGVSSPWSRASRRGNAGQIMEDPLVDAQGRAAERPTLAQLDQPPSPQ